MVAEGILSRCLGLKCACCMGSGCLACFARSQTPLKGARRQASAAAAPPAPAAVLPPVPPPVPAANPASFSHERVERLPEGEFKQELMDCLGQGGTPCDFADLAYSLFPPAPPGVVLPPHPDLPGVQLHQPGLPAPQTLPSATCGGASWTLFFYAHKLTRSGKIRSQGLCLEQGAACHPPDPH